MAAARDESTSDVTTPSTPPGTGSFAQRPAAPATGFAAHRLRVPMVGRDPDEEHRVSSPLELLFDLTFVVAISLAAGELAHSVESGDYLDGYQAFAMIFFAIWWAWLNFTWFASAYDVDDVPFRLLALLQIGGVLLLAAGVPAAFERLDYTTVTIGYLVMRVAMVLQWLRAAVDDRAGRATALRYAGGIAVVQVAWTARLAAPDWHPLLVFALLVLAEVAVPFTAERGRITPWHPHHISERYSLFAIIVMGECVLASSNALRVGVSMRGVNSGVVVLGGAGLVLVFAMWWLYFLGDVSSTLEGRQRTAYMWGFGHYAVFASIAAVGAGLEVAAYGLANVHLVASHRAVGLAIACPVAVYLLSQWAVHTRLHGRSSLTGLSVAVVAVATVATALVGSSLDLPLLVVLLALPSAGLVGWELWRGTGAQRRASEGVPA